MTVEREEASCHAHVAIDVVCAAMVALNRGEASEPAVIELLSRAIGADAGISVLLGSVAPLLISAAYPDEATATPLAEFALTMVGRRVTHYMEGTVPELGHTIAIHLPRPCDAREGPVDAVVFGFTVADGTFRDGYHDLLETCCRPLAQLWPIAQKVCVMPERPAAGAPDRHGISGRELEVLELLAQGLLATSIAARLGLSARTVHKHLGNIYRKLGVHDRLVAVSIARDEGILPPYGIANRQG